jgi:6-pyruvoyl-tetrahydropterin synthase
MFLVFSSAKKVNPRDIIKNRLDLLLPVTSEIINYDYHKSEDTFYAKILIDKSDVENIKNDLIDSFDQEFIIHSIKQIPRFENTVTWWDMDKDKIEDCFHMNISGKPRLFKSVPKTIEIWAFIVKQNDETYYLYIAS